MSERYRPSCAFEGADFQERWCNCCIHDAGYRDGNPEKGCQILASTYALEADDEDYPSEWTFSDAGKPICTAFEREGDEPIRCWRTPDLFDLIKEAARHGR